jgi:hypothetical protein
MADNRPVEGRPIRTKLVVSLEVSGAVLFDRKSVVKY